MKSLCLSLSRNPVAVWAKLAPLSKLNKCSFQFFRSYTKAIGKTIFFLFPNKKVTKTLRNLSNVFRCVDRCLRGSVFGFFYFKEILLI